MIEKALILGSYEGGQNEGGPAGFIATNYKGHDMAYCRLVTRDSVRAPKRSFAQRLLHHLNFAVAQPIKRRFGRRPVYSTVPWVENLRFSAMDLFMKASAWDYRIVVFHDVYCLYFCIPLLQRGQTAVLYPHCPELPHEELTAFFGCSESSEVVKWVRDVVTPQAFGRADAIILPNDGVTQIYESVLPPSARVFFVPTGSAGCKKTERIPLNPNLKHFLYIGRKHKIKGYDLLLEGFAEAFKQNSDMRLYVAGKGKAEYAPGVIDLQGVELPGTWMGSVDCVVNVNRQSFFDRSVIEALSIGAPMIVACTYGHSELRGQSSGILDIGSASASSIEQALLQVSRSGFSADDRSANYSLYARRYSDSKHREMFEQAMCQLLQRNSSFA